MCGFESNREMVANMTNIEATRIVAEWMKIKRVTYCDNSHAFTLPGDRLFDPARNAKHEQLVREYARQNLREHERIHVRQRLERVVMERIGRADEWPIGTDTGDLTRAIAKVLAERMHAMHMSPERVQEPAKNDHVVKGGDAT